jgi:GNAT superfamily N-acetyltransferase
MAGDDGESTVPEDNRNVRIRVMATADTAAGLELCRLSRWNQLAEDWRRFLDSPDGGARLAERDGVVAGTVAWLRYGAGFTWLSMMLVHPEARRGGIGTRLMEAAIEALAAEACIRLDATPAGEPLYRRFGFEGEYELVRARASRRQCSATGAARPMEPHDFHAVFARDREIFGADRSALLASFYDRAPEMARILRRGDTLAGYCFGRPGHLYRQVGPVVADDEAAAQDLVASCPGEELAIDVPRSVPAWTARLESDGFTIERPFLRMGRGTSPSPGIPALQFAIAGPEFG